MEHIMEHYGKAILTAVILVALAVMIVGLISGDFVPGQFQTAMTDFFTNMSKVK